MRFGNHSHTNGKTTKGEKVQEYKAPEERAGALPQQSENNCRDASSKRAQRANDACDGSDSAGKELRDELEDRAVAQANRQGHPQRADGERDGQGA